MDEIIQRAGHDAVDHDPLNRLHAARVDAGMAHYRRDIGNAPWPEDRVPGRSYSTIGTPPPPRERKAPSSAPPGADLTTRAVAVLGRGPRGVQWPYGLETPRRRNYETEAAYTEALQDRSHAQQTITSWAEEHGLRQSSSGCCPRWLQRRCSRRCSDGHCTHYDPPAPDHGWLDHLVSWLLDGKPAVLTSALYDLPEAFDDRVELWTRNDPRLRMTRGPGWYGAGTTQVVMWRSDLLDPVAPAGRAGLANHV